MAMETSPVSAGEPSLRKSSSSLPLSPLPLPCFFFGSRLPLQCEYHFDSTACTFHPPAQYAKKGKWLVISFIIASLNSLSTLPCMHLGIIIYQSLRIVASLLVHTRQNRHADNNRARRVCTGTMGMPVMEAGGPADIMLPANDR
jgi:hypothetical protein